MTLLARIRAALDARNYASVKEATRTRAAEAVVASFTPGTAAPTPIGLKARVDLALDERMRTEDPRLFGEVKRICELPIRVPLTPAEVDDISKRWVLDREYRKGFRLFPLQAQAIREFEELGAIFGPIPVGWGKTLVDLMVAEHAFQTHTARTLLIVPAQVFEQLMRRDIQWARGKIRFSVPIYGMGDADAKRRSIIARSGRRGCYVTTYSMLSTKDAEATIRAIKPGLVIADEAHYLKNYRAARTRRLMDLLADLECGLVAMSGTITSKKVRDYHHIIRHALGDGSPLPDSPMMANEWGLIVDSDAMPTDAMTGPIRPLVAWARKHFPSEEIPAGVPGFRRAYRLRLVSSPGVVAGGEQDIGVSLILANHPVPKEVCEASAGWAKLQELQEKLETTWTTPNGDAIDHQIHLYKWLYEFSAGFYHEPYWDAPEDLQRKRAITLADARVVLAKAMEHHEAANIYAKKLRKWFSDGNARIRLDTPMLVGQSMSVRGAEEVGKDLYEAWSDAQELKFDGMPERESRAIRVCDYKIKLAVEWAKWVLERKESPKEGAIIWIHHQEIGAWLTERLTEVLGPERVFYAKAGKKYDIELSEEKRLDANKTKIVVASVSAHGTGKNLQGHFSESLFLQWPRPAKVAEQALGRIHRNGQLEDEVVQWRCDTTLFDEMVFAACLNDALYVHQTTATRYRLIYASYAPQPRIFPHDVLAERGLEPDALTLDQRAMLLERFGEFSK